MLVYQRVMINSPVISHPEIRFSLMFSVHFPSTNYGHAEVADQWGRSAAGGWFPAHGNNVRTAIIPFLARLQNLEARQPERNRRNLMPTNFQQENMGNPTPARLFLGFPYQKGLWSPNFGYWAQWLLFQPRDLVRMWKPRRKLKAEKQSVQCSETNSGKW